MDQVSLKLVMNYGCKHAHIEIDEKLSQVRCTDCGSWLNPVQFLADMAGQQAVMEFKLDALERQVAEIETKNRCKCVHCGMMTPITHLKVFP